MEHSNAPPDTSTAQSTEDLIMKLSAELRNKIYEFALQEEWSLIDIGPYCRWKEPALLKASKQIRSEALPLYYHINNNFKTYVRTHHIAQVVEWLEGIRSKCSNTLPFASFTVYIGQHSGVTDLGQFLPLLEFLRTTEEKIFENDRREKDILPSWLDCGGLLCIMRDFLAKAIQLGYQAKAKGWSAERLAEEFEKKVAKKKATKGYKHYVVGQRRKQQQFERSRLATESTKQARKRDKYKAELEKAEQKLSEIRDEFRELEQEAYEGFSEEEGE